MSLRLTDAEHVEFMETVKRDAAYTLMSIKNFADANPDSDTGVPQITDRMMFIYLLIADQIPIWETAGRWGRFCVDSAAVACNVTTQTILAWRKIIHIYGVYDPETRYNHSSAFLENNPNKRTKYHDYPKHINQLIKNLSKKNEVTSPKIETPQPKPIEVPMSNTDFKFSHKMKVITFLSGQPKSKLEVYNILTELGFDSKNIKNQLQCIVEDTDYKLYIHPCDIESVKTDEFGDKIITTVRSENYSVKLM